ncbi:lipid-transfer protein [Nakamurella leprariae]|uniref:propanoyl-CoA C-acyltransferase n=1 Tax=Nakamurella leprariae TaxID=2803911 RepID=A0A938Y874_9ACTN|nr:lipid-transfer protein [Nakamurella leprariae]MBM9467821.1 lipid-transfer protein [Nakamurella leprariae]
MNDKAVVAGVGMTPFVKVGTSAPYFQMAAEAGRRALDDAGIDYDAVQVGYASYVLGDSTAGQRGFYELGTTGIPIFNLNNNCSSGSSALYLARQAVETGIAEVALAIGFEQMPGKGVTGWLDDRPTALEPYFAAVATSLGIPDDRTAGSAVFFGAAGQQYCERYDIDPALFGHITVKSRRHAAANPNAIFREPLTLEQVLASPTIWGPLTRFECCPPTSGAAAAVIVSPEYARKHGLRSDVVIAGQAMSTDLPGAFDGDMMKLVGYDMTLAASRAVYEQTGVGPDDLTVVELHDCFASNEVLTYEALGLTPEGSAEKFVLEGENTYGGRVVTNPSGGLISKGHPLGATGLAQCAELTWQLRGEAGGRQVAGAPRHALQHNVGLGGACVVTMYAKVGD